MFDSSLKRIDLEIVKFFSLFFLILYGIDPNTFSGGFIALDIIFVLVGFYSTNLILKNYQNTSFNYLIFSNATVKKVIFLLIITIFISGIISVKYQSGKEINFFFLNSFYSFLFLSNFFFEINQFDFFLPKSQYFPLLHTWVLSLIVQFYIIFGLAFYIWHPNKLNKNLLFFLIFFLLIICFLLTLFGANFKSSYPFIEENEKLYIFNQPPWATFLSPISSIWEFLMGALCSLITQYEYKYLRKFKKNKILYYFGLVFILISFIAYSSNLQHPSLFILPCLLGLFFVLINEEKILFKKQIYLKRFFNYFSSLYIIIFFLYFPIIVFSKYLLFEKFDYYKYLILILIYFTAALIKELSQKKIISKFINRGSIYLYTYGIVILLLFSQINFFNFDKSFFFNDKKNRYINENFEFVYDDKVKFLSTRTDYLKKKRIRFTEFEEHIEKSNRKFSNINNKKILIIGNSQSQDMFLMFDTNKDLFEEYEFRYFRIHLSNFLKRDKLEKKKIDLFLNDQLFIDSDVILIASNFRKYGRYSDDFDSIIKINELIKKFDKKIVLTSNQIIFDSKYYPTYDLIHRFAHHNSLLLDYVDFEMFKMINKNEFRKNIILEKIAKDLNMPFLKKYEFFCDFVKLKCKSFTNSNYPIRLDDYHVTLEGAKYLGNVINETNWFNIGD